MNKRRAVFFLLVAGLIPVGLRADTVVSAKIRQTEIRSAVVLPVQKDIARKAQGLPRPDSESPELDLYRFGQMVVDALRERGITVAEARPEPTSLPSTKAAISEAQTSYDELAGDLIRNRQGVEKGTFNLGGVLPKLGHEIAADAFVFVRAQTAYESGGLLGKALKMVTGPAFIDGYVSLVDGHKGEVLFFTTVACYVNEQDVCARRLRKAFRKLPAPAPSLPGTK